MTTTIRLGISTCPNDTFAFHALMNHCIDLKGLNFETQLLDIEELNRRILAGELDIAKASFALAHQVSDSWYVLPSGSALGFGVGPVLLAAEPGTEPTNNSQTTLCPGEHTTANMLFQMYYGQTAVRQTVFSRIIPALQNGDADFGVCIHEGRFTYASCGLSLVEDLGSLWETETGCPLPLGGILARRDLGPATIGKVQGVIRASIEYGLDHRQETLPTMRRFAQELDDEVLFQHVDLYVNEWTIDLATIGQHSLATMSAMINAANHSGANAKMQIFRPDS